METFKPIKKFSPYLEEEVSKMINKKGYWKQSLVCKYAYKLGLTLKESWELLNFYIEDYYFCISQKYVPKISSKMEVERHNLLMRSIKSEDPNWVN